MLTWWGPVVGVWEGAWIVRAAAAAASNRPVVLGGWLMAGAGGLVLFTIEVDRAPNHVKVDG
jgi:hypothetical protein